MQNNNFELLERERDREEKLRPNNNNNRVNRFYFRFFFFREPLNDRVIFRSIVLVQPQALAFGVFCWRNGKHRVQHQDNTRLITNKKMCIYLPKGQSQRLAAE